MHRFQWIVFVCLGLASLSFKVIAGDMTLQVATQGQFVKPQVYNVSSGARLSVIADQWQLKPGAYRLGISLLRVSQQRWQSRLRWALLYRLEDLELNSQTKKSLHNQVIRFAATGRVLYQFNWDSIELNPKQNRPLKQEDVFVAPVRPKTITVGGAAMQATLKFIPGLSVAKYMGNVRRLPGYDPSYVWVVTPDTHIRRIGVSYWNTQQAYLAPGSIIYVPLKSNFAHSYKKFNQSMMRLYAAQVLPQ
ncbi:MAG: hypothetical protein CENE_00504 [Candidatus Celerinatantimonas neptuna]|nr:MAG: hypothetical protein CENE_00504 [Candidatus Celerinatantimonas neptuna]